MRKSAEEIRRAMVMAPTPRNKMRPLSDFTIVHRPPPQADEAPIDFSDILWPLFMATDDDDAGTRG